MSVTPVTMYRVVCDWPGCDASPQDDTDYWAWSDAGIAVDGALDADWLVGSVPDTHFCRDHPSTWASDHEGGESYPEPPYLLIHDGDRMLDDDGKATLVEAGESA